MVEHFMSNSTERIGVSYCALTAERNNWMFREQPINDIGIDAHMEFVEDDKPRQLLALQIKSGSSWFKEKKDDCIIFRNINERQYNYWTMNSLPCIVILYNPDDNMCIWQELTTETIKRTKDGSGKGFYVKVPINQSFLDELSNEKLLAYTNLPQHIQNYNFLLSQKKFMVKKLKSMPILIGFRLHPIPMFFLDCFHGQIFLLMKNLLKKVILNYGNNFIVGMIVKWMIGSL